MKHETVWEFRTAEFRVALEIKPETDDPRDSFEDEESCQDIYDGRVAWFQARVCVYWRGNRIAWDALGGCAYRDVEEFYTAHRDPDPANRNCAATNAKHVICHYFPDMVRQAVAMARSELCKAPKLRCA